MNAPVFTSGAQRRSWNFMWSTFAFTRTLVVSALSRLRCSWRNAAENFGDTNCDGSRKSRWLGGRLLTSKPTVNGSRSKSAQRPLPRYDSQNARAPVVAPASDAGTTSVSNEAHAMEALMATALEAAM